MQRNINQRCKGKTKAGKPCRAAATEGGLCFFHANPNKASELGRIGGRKMFRLSPETIEPLPALDSARAVRDAGARLIAETFAGKVHPRIAAGLAPLLSLQLRAIESTRIEDRINKLENKVAKLQAQGNNQGNPSRPLPPTPVRPQPEKRFEYGDPAQPLVDL